MSIGSEYVAGDPCKVIQVTIPVDLGLPS